MACSLVPFAPLLWTGIFVSERGRGRIRAAFGRNFGICESTVTEVGAQARPDGSQPCGNPDGAPLTDAPVRQPAALPRPVCRRWRGYPGKDGWWRWLRDGQLNATAPVLGRGMGALMQTFPNCGIYCTRLRTCVKRPKPCAAEGRGRTLTSFDFLFCLQLPIIKLRLLIFNCLGTHFKRRLRDYWTWTFLRLNLS